MKIKIIDENSIFLKEVITLSEINKNKLGFLPKSVFSEKAKNKKIICAINRGKLAGYLMYGCNQRESLVYIVHICIDPLNRKKGVAKSLIDHLISMKKAMRGIRVHCRRDYNLSKFWQGCGFTAISEKRGRGLNRTTITIWWYDYEQPSIFNYGYTIRSKNKLIAVIDANIFFEIFGETNGQDENVACLFSDWVQDSTEFCLTKEIYNEIDRNTDEKKRKKYKGIANHFTIVPSKPHVFKKIIAILCQSLPIGNSIQDQSDMRQLAHTISNEIPFFITCDKKLISKSSFLSEKFDTEIIHPSNFITYQDSLLHKNEYEPYRFEGTQIKDKRIINSSDIINKYYHIFSCREKKSDFSNRLHYFLSKPELYEIKVLIRNGEPIAIYVLDRTEINVLKVPFLRIITDSLTPTVSIHLIYSIVKLSVNEKISLTIISEKKLTDIIIDAIKYHNFSKFGDRYYKVSLQKIMSLNDLELKLKSLQDSLPNYGNVFYEYANYVRDKNRSSGIEELILIEKKFFPLKLSDLNLPLFVVPIKPYWAMHLFDSEIANQDLFGANPDLILKPENVYYRSAKNRILKSPARIFWYVSGSKSNYSGVKCIKAVSYLDEVHIGNPKEMFSLFRKYGVYTWQNVYKLADSDINKNIMALKFSFTEILSREISFDSLNEFFKTSIKKNFNPVGPLQIPDDFIGFLYKWN